MITVSGVYDIETGVVESVYRDDTNAAERAKYMTQITGRKHGVYLIADAPPNVHHYHYRITELEPETMRTEVCSNPLCSRRPRYWKSEEYGYWSVETCYENITREMANNLTTRY